MINNFTVIEIDIVSVLRENRVSGLSCSEIANLTDNSIQAIAYNVKKLLARKLLFSDSRSKKYYLQPFISEDHVYNALNNALITILKNYESLILLDENWKLTDNEKTNIFYDSMILTSLLSVSEIMEEDEKSTQNDFE